MRALPLILCTLAASGCVSRFVLRDFIPEVVCDQPFYLDPDEDGWGDPTSEPQLACAANPDEGYTATNARDCRENDPDVTGLIGSTCGDDLVAGGADYVGVVDGDTEYVATIGTTPAVFWELAESACSPTGWGGAIATFDKRENLDFVTDRLDAEYGAAVGYAAFVGIGPNDARDGWEWVDGSTLQLIEVGFCDDVAPAIGAVGLENERLALVKPAGTTEWCFGRPPSARQSDAGYDANHGHFLCERSAPDPADWPDWPDSEAVDSGQ